MPLAPVLRMRLVEGEGFSLLEVLIAATLVAGTIVTLVALLMRTADQSVRTERATQAALAAQAKLEELRAAPFAFDAGGGAIDGPGMAVSPADAHLTDTPGFFDNLGRFGEAVPSGSAAAYARRWSVRAASAGADTRVLTVCVQPLGSRASATRPACLWTVRTRQP